MRQVSDRFKASIGGANAWANDIRWSNADGVWSDPVQLMSGTVTEDATSQVRWTCSLVLYGVPVGDDGINPWSTHLTVRHGIDYGDGHPELLGMGVYRIESVERSNDNPDVVTVTGSSFEAFLIDATFSSPRDLAATDPKGRIAELIQEVIPAATIWWDPRIDDSPWLPAISVEQDRWGTIDGGRADGSVAKALGAQVYVNGDGVWIVAPVPTLKDPTTWEATVGPGGVLINSTENLTSDGVKNQIIVSGESTSGAASVGPVVVSDDDPYSRTYIKGRFGRRPMYYTNQNIGSLGQALVAGNGLLAPRLGLHQQVTFDSLHDPTKEAGDVGDVTVPSGVQKTILDQVAYDLLGGQLQTQTRATIALPGGAADIPADPEGLSA